MHLGTVSYFRVSVILMKYIFLYIAPNSQSEWSVFHSEIKRATDEFAFRLPNERFVLFILYGYISSFFPPSESLHPSQFLTTINHLIILTSGLIVLSREPMLLTLRERKLMVLLVCKNNQSYFTFGDAFMI